MPSYLKFVFAVSVSVSLVNAYPAWDISAAGNTPASGNVSASVKPSLSKSISVTQTSVTSTVPSATPTKVDCNDGTWERTVNNYKKFQTDQNLRTWWVGGKGSDGITYKARKGDKFTEFLAQDFQPTGDSFVCNLESHACQPAEGCESYAVHLSDGQHGPPSHWSWFAIHSISNLWAFSSSFKDGITNAGVYTSDLNLDLTKVFTKPSTNPDFATLDILLGFSFSVISFFSIVPAVVADSALISALGGDVGVAIGTGGSFLGNTLSANNKDLATKAADFGAYMAQLFDSTQNALDKFVEGLMSGSIDNSEKGGDATILTMLDGGTFVTDNLLRNPRADISSITTYLQKDFIQRGINHIWSQSKIWVSFVDLQDDDAQSKCKADRNGWQDSKTCLHGGVYYLYRYSQDGKELGNLDYPWGADKMAAAPWNLSPQWVTRSSALAYRAQNNGAGGFNYDHSKAPQNLDDLFHAIAQGGSFDNIPPMEGVWNISVCDMGTHSDWNYDFTQSEQKSVFPCCCGPQCSQTRDFVKSAQMDNFDNLYTTCRDQQLNSCDAWPPGATVVDFGRRGTVKKKTHGKDCT